MNKSIEDLRIIPAILSIFIGLLFISTSLMGYGFGPQKWYRMFRRNRLSPINPPGVATQKERLKRLLIGITLLVVPLIWFLYRMSN